MKFLGFNLISKRTIVWVGKHNIFSLGMGVVNIVESAPKWMKIDRHLVSIKCRWV